LVEYIRAFTNTATTVTMQYMAILCIVLLQASLLAADQAGKYKGTRLIERFSGKNEAFGANEVYDDMYDADAEVDVDAYDYEDDGLYYEDDLFDAAAYEEEENDENVYADDGLYYDEEGAYDYDDAEEGDYAYDADAEYYDDEEGDYAYDDEEYYDEDMEDYAEGDYYDDDEGYAYDADLYDDEYYGEYGENGDYYDEDYESQMAALQQMYSYNAYQQMYNEQYAKMMREYANLYGEADQYTQNYADQMEGGHNAMSKKKEYNPSQSVANAYNAYQNEYGYY